jgi:hypothetical protein
MILLQQHMQYPVEQVNAVARPRIKGRFVKPQELADHVALQQVGHTSHRFYS